MSRTSRTWTVMGLMSGTSMDGIDIVVANVTLTDSGLEFEILSQGTTPFADADREAIKVALSGDADALADLHYRLGELYAKAAENAASAYDLDLAGLHGQTVAHKDGAYSLQLGSPSPLASRLGVPVIFNFREADIAAGGRGAPLMPYLDWLLTRERTDSVLTLNLGGIANISYIPGGGQREDVIGFDTGPAMSLIDCACGHLFNQRADMDGKLSAGGTVDAELLELLMGHPYISRKPPKSTGVDEFGDEMVADILNGFSGEDADLLRTLIAFTARSVASNIKGFVPPDGQGGVMAISGGGASHPTVVADLSRELPAWQIGTSQILGVDPDFKEALLMAVLAVAKMENRAASMPSVTGARREIVLGHMA